MRAVGVMRLGMRFRGRGERGEFGLYIVGIAMDGGKLIPRLV